jgi:protein-tyrosine phosphatase
MSEQQETSVTTGKTHKSLFSKHGLRQVVSQKRVRFQDKDFDLDLSYICPNVLAMGLPANGMDAMFRNNEQDVANMLNKFHPSSYMIYNLAQKKYDYSLFENRVREWGWKDHHAPGLELLFKNVNDMCEFLKQDIKNVVIVHCKAGKGRTGTSIAALLVYCGLYRTPEEALKYFSYRRANTIDPKGGVTIPSQKRYIKYFADILAGRQTPNRNKYKINSISISGVPMYDKKNGAKLVVHVMHDTVTEIYNGKKEQIKLEPVTHTYGTFQAQGLQDTELDGDIMLRFANVGFFNEETRFRISFNTHMIEGDEIYWVFYRHDLDDAYKDDDVPSQFKLEIRMSRCGEAAPWHAGVQSEWQKALKNRGLYQNMFTKMSYQASTVYDPANNIGDVMDDVPNFLSQPQVVVNGVILENQSAQNSFASQESWELQQEERFLQEQALHGQIQMQQRVSGNMPTSGSFNAYTPNPIAPHMSTSYQSFASPSLPNNVPTQPPPLPRRPKPSLAQWDAYFQQHQTQTMGPASILGVMLQLPSYPLQVPVPPATPTSYVPPPPPPTPAPIAPGLYQPLASPTAGMTTSPSFNHQPQYNNPMMYNNNNNNNNTPVGQYTPQAQYAPQQPTQYQPQQTSYTSGQYTPLSQQSQHSQQSQTSSLPAPPPPPPSSPNPNTQNTYALYPTQSQLQASVTHEEVLPPAPVPPTQYQQPMMTTAATQPTNGYNLYAGGQGAYSQQYQQLQSLQAGNNAPPVLPRRPPMMPPGQQPH